MFLPRYHRLLPFLLRLDGAECDKCGTRFLPARRICSICRSCDHTPFHFSGKGRLAAASEIFVPPSGFGDTGPYLVGLVSLDEGVNVAAQLTDLTAEDARPGMRVKAVTRKLSQAGDDGLIVYGYKFCLDIGDGFTEG